MLPFNPDLNALSMKKERYMWLTFMGIVFFLLYGASNEVANRTMPHPSFFMEWEINIPFIEAFIVPYMSSDLMFVIAFILPYTRMQLRVLSARVLFIVVFSCLIFILFPLQFSFLKPEMESFSLLFGALEADLPFNQLPSLHISFAVVLYMSMREHIHNKFIKYMVLAWFFLIAMSTLFVYQHHFIDLPTGFLMGILAVKLIDKNSYVVCQFSTPRSLKMAFYYLGASVGLMILSLTVPQLKWLFIYLFVSMFSLSIVYAFGLNSFLAGETSKANFFQKVIFFPYFIGSYVSWAYYKRQLSLIVKVKENVYIGRYPSHKEYLSLENISHLINLASEQQCFKRKKNEIRLPFLDQTIQSPQSLHKGVELIEKHKEEGVYIHCALGLSRSVLQVSAWLLFKGYSFDEVNALMKEVRPRYVRSKYMTINLQLYVKYLNE